MRQLVELEWRGDCGDLAAEGRDRLADEEPSEGRVAAERAEVDGEPANEAGLADLGGFQLLLEKFVVVVRACGRFEQAAGAAAEVGQVDLAALRLLGEPLGEVERVVEERLAEGG